MKPSRLTTLIALGVLLVACTNPAPVTTSTTGPKRASAKPSATATPVPAPGGLLQRPAGNALEIAGTVQLEASYAVAQGGATLITNNGASVLQLGDAALVANNGGNIISNNGGTIISDHAAGLVSQTKDGPALVSQTKDFGLLAAEPLPTIGTVLPAAGLTLGVVDLLTGQLLEVGRGADGNPAKAIVTNSAGAYRAFLPPGTKTSVRVVAVGSEDPRLQTNLITSRPGTSATLDEDTPQVANIVRSVIAIQNYRMMVKKPGEPVPNEPFYALLDDKLRADVDAGLNKFRERFADLQVSGFTREKNLRIAYRMADVVLAHTDLEGIVTTSGQKPAMDASREVMQALRVRVGEVMAKQASLGKDPSAYFAAKAYIKDAAARDQESYAIRKPSDFDDFLIRGVLANPNLSGVEAPKAASKVFHDPDVIIVGDPLNLLIESQLAVALELARLTYSTDKPLLPEVLAVLEAEAKR
ncbi:MAG: hypothetical protein JWM80_2738 [Cyanobacteria bacterium RYN_339]|nr:hypothetical protein [Cyanobacteria bacterium RYN_339]